MYGVPCGKHDAGTMDSWIWTILPVTVDIRIVAGVTWSPIAALVEARIVTELSLEGVAVPIVEAVIKGVGWPSEKARGAIAGSFWGIVCCEPSS